MASETSHSQGPEQTEQPRVERTTREVGIIARKMIGEKAPAAARKPEGDRTDAEKALNVYNRIQTDENPNFDFDGNGLPIEGFRAGSHTFADGEASVAGLFGATKTGKLLCSVRDKDGNIVLDEDGAPQLFTMDREKVLDAQAYAEKDKLGGLFEGDDKKIFDAYKHSLPQNAAPLTPGTEVNALLEQAAEQHNVLQVKDVQAFIESLPEDKKNNPEVKDILADMQGGVVVSAEDFKYILELTGHSKDAIDEMQTEATASLNELRDKHDALPADAPEDERNTLDDQIKTAENRLKLLGHASDVLTEPEVPEVEDFNGKSAELQRVDEAFGVRMSELKKQVDVLEAEQNVLLAKGDDLSEGKLRELESLRAHYNSLAYVTKLRGPAGVAFRRAAANQALLYAEQDSVTSAGTHQIRRVLREGAELAQEEARTKSILADKLEAAGIEENLRRSAQEVLSSPQKLAEYLSGTSKDAEMTALLNDPRLTEIMYEGNNTLDIDNFLSATEASLTDEQKGVLEKAKRWGKGGVLVGAGLAAILLALTGAAMMFVVKGVADSGRAA